MRIIERLRYACHVFVHPSAAAASIVVVRAIVRGKSSEELVVTSNDGKAVRYRVEITREVDDE